MIVTAQSSVGSSREFDRRDPLGLNERRQPVHRQKRDVLLVSRHRAAPGFHRHRHAIERRRSALLADLFQVRAGAAGVRLEDHRRRLAVAERRKLRGRRCGLLRGRAGGRRRRCLCFSRAAEHERGKARASRGCQGQLHEIAATNA
jgi:hypothetical protein